MMKIQLVLGAVLVFSACSGSTPKSSEEKASEMTKSLLKEMHKQDSIKALMADTVLADTLK